VVKEKSEECKSGDGHLEWPPRIVEFIHMRNMKNSTLEELLILLIIWIRNDAIMNEEDDEAEDSRRSMPTKQIKISIQLSFHIIVLLCICLYLVDVLCMIGCLH